VSSAGHSSHSQTQLRADRRSGGATKAIFLMSALSLATILTCASWIYAEGTTGLRRLRNSADVNSTAVNTSNATEILRQTQDWLQHLTLVTGAGALGTLLFIVMVVLWYRRIWVNRSDTQKAEIQSLNAQLEKAQIDQALQKAERRRVEDELQKTVGDIDKKVESRTAQLSESHSRLQKELNDRRQAERVMAQQAKELERSKDVLELHVQARTQELQKLQRRYESILNSAGEGIYGLDLQGRTTFVNPAAAKITGWKVDELVGREEGEVFHHQAGVVKFPGANPEQNQADFIIFYRNDGSSFPAEYIRTPIYEKDKEVGAVVIFKDITERKRAEETLNRKAAELARSNAELEQFAYVASHDLQEPLRKIQAFGDRLKAKCDAVNLQDGRDYLERMQSAAARMQTLINDLLTFSRVISASQPLVPVDLNTVVKGVLGDLEYRIEQTKARIEQGDLPTIEADPLQMRQLFQNLIGNALKFQPADHQPLVKISAQILKSPFAGTADEDPYAEQCEISIQDNGIGFDEKYLDKIFAVFQRLHGRNEFEGTGVGLAVCRRITDRHGGIITAHSKAGEGATFVITLPLRQAALQQAA
jgi:PAS domain S-box-containing protein